MTELIIFLIGSVGMTFIIIEGTIFESTREFIKNKMPKFFYSLISCYTCSGFWCGLIAGYFCLTHNPALVFFCGCTASLLSNLTAQFVSLTDAVIYKNLDE